MTSIASAPNTAELIVPANPQPATENAESQNTSEILSKENVIKATRVALVVLGVAVIPGGGIAAAVAGTALLINRLRTSKKNLRPASQQMA